MEAICFCGEANVATSASATYNSKKKSFSPVGKVASPKYTMPGPDTCTSAAQNNAYLSMWGAQPNSNIQWLGRTRRGAGDCM